jgi:hypothetical protein
MAAASAATARNLFQSVDRKFASDPILQRLAHELSDWRQLTECLRFFSDIASSTYKHALEFCLVLLQQCPRCKRAISARIDPNGPRFLAMSALGQKRTFGSFITMSALPPKADIEPRR